MDTNPSSPTSPIIIQTNQSAPSSSPNQKGYGKWVIRVILLVLVVVIGLEIFNAAKLLNKSKSATPVFARLQPLSGGHLTLLADKKEYQVGETITVSVRMFTGGHPTDGTDLVLKYDPKLLEITSAFFAKGNTYNDYPFSSFDPTKGEIQISGITSLSQNGFNGAGVFGTLTMKAKSAGIANLTIDFTPDRTTDSNMVESTSAKDILSQVDNLSLTIK